MLAHALLMLGQFYHSSFMLGAMAGLLPVIWVDYQAFRHFQSLHELAEYGWSTALFRWVQGFIVGGLAATVFRGITG